MKQPHSLNLTADTVTWSQFIEHAQAEGARLETIKTKDGDFAILFLDDDQENTRYHPLPKHGEYDRKMGVNTCYNACRRLDLKHKIPVII